MIQPRRCGSVACTSLAGPVRSINANSARVAPYTGMNRLRRPHYVPDRVEKSDIADEKINVDIKDGDIHNVLRVLAKTGNVNIVTSDEVSGTVTMHLKLVPWDQALDMVLRTKGLDMVREGTSYESRLRNDCPRARGRAKEAGSQRALKPLEIKMITVNHANAEELIPRIRVF